jgi:two-component sensor histidine kinase
VRDVTQPPEEGLGEAEDHLHRLMAAWQLIADLSFADLLLFVDAGDERFRIVGQMRPYTARTLYPADLVGEVVESGWHPFVERAWRERRRLRAPQAVFIDAEPVRVETVPVRRRGTVLAVLSVEAAEVPARATGRLEAAYLQAADALLEMVADGTFPFKEALLVGSPRVGDGLITLDAGGRVTFASPNATSAFRRMGTNSLPPGQPLPNRVAVLVAESMAGRRPIESDVEGDGAVTDVRVMPLLRHVTERRGALVLCRDVTELRRRERVISRREATIREVHHRVKNNLQTVASLLRLQARRLTDHPMAVDALEESVRRIASIALVHETLTEEPTGAVDMGDVARRVVRMLEGSLGSESVRIVVEAEYVRVGANVATPLSVVLNELVQNALEHGLCNRAGTVTVGLHTAEGGGLELEVIDDGNGPPAETEPEPVARPGGGLGLRLVRALVEEELGGRFTLTRAGEHGSVARAIIPPQQPDQPPEPETGRT